MTLSDFLSRQKHDDSNPHEIISITFNMQSILQARYYNLGEGNLGKYLVQTRSKVISCGIKLPEVHGIGKGLDPNISTREASYKAYSSCRNERNISDKTKVRPRPSRPKM